METVHTELKSITNSPKLYLINYFDDIRKQIDIESQIYMNKKKLGAELKERALEEQLKMINEVDSFQKKCLNHLATHPIDQLNLDAFENLDLNDKSSKVGLEKLLYCELYARKKALFMNTGLLFLDNEKCMLYSSDDYNEETDKWDKKRPIDSILFGVLILVQDEFLEYSNKFKLIHEREKKFDEEWTNDYLKISFLSKILTKKVQCKKLGAVNRIKLKLNQIENLEISEQYFSQSSIKQWFLDLPALKKVSLTLCKLGQLDPTFFQSSIYLEEIIIVESCSFKDSNMFSGLKNLRKLQLTSNKIKSLSGDAFKGLNNLIELNISFNNLTTLPQGLFNDLVNLKKLDIGWNEIVSLPNGLFKNLVNLEILSMLGCQANTIPEEILSCQTLKKLDLCAMPLKKLDPKTFKNLVNLEVLLMFNCQLQELDPNTFSSNKKLRILHLHSNQLSNLHKDLFKGLVHLETLNFVQNQIRTLPKGLFKDQVNLKHLNIGRNELSSFPDGFFRELPSLKGCMFLGNPGMQVMFKNFPPNLRFDDFNTDTDIKGNIGSTKKYKTWEDMIDDEDNDDGTTCIN